jgi:hypothetical protein
MLPEPESGAALLDGVRAVLTRYVVFPDAASADAYTLWLAATHAQDAWEHATRFVFNSPIRRCGKTRAQEVGRELAHNPICTTNISVAAFVRSIDEKDPPTLFIDEADTIFGKSKAEGAEDLRGIVNTGHSRGWPYMRWNVTSRTREECPTFAMALLGGIGNLPDTIEDRAVVVAMRRRARHEQVNPFRRRRAVPELHELRERVHAWVRSLDDLGTYEPALPVEDRDADKWEPLVAIADAAGGHWPETARDACRVMCEAAEDENATAVRVLADVWAVFRDDEPHIFSAELCARLNALDEAAWIGWNNAAGIKPHDLARHLKAFKVKSRTVRIGDKTAKGYTREDLADPVNRYVTAVTESHGPKTLPLTSENGCDGGVTFADLGTVTWSEQGKQASCDGVTPVSLTHDETVDLLCHQSGATIADSAEAASEEFLREWNDVVDRRAEEEQF